MTNADILDDRGYHRDSRGASNSRAPYGSGEPRYESVRRSAVSYSRDGSGQIKSSDRDAQHERSAYQKASDRRHTEESDYRDARSRQSQQSAYPSGSGSGRSRVDDRGPRSTGRSNGGGGDYRDEQVLYRPGSKGFPAVPMGKDYVPRRSS